jgi:hypothetical protein
VPRPSSISADDAREFARLALEEIDRMPDVEQRRIYAGSLNAALEPLRNLPAVEVLCGARGCTRRVCWWALAPGVASVAATEHLAPPKRRFGGIADLAEPKDPQRHVFGWIELAERGTTSVRLVDVKTPGWPVRLKFVCRCGADYTLTNTVRLRRFLTAIRSIGPVLLTIATQVK